jgi:hypothetical protein
MALTAYTVLEIEAGSGSDTNGGGFDPSQTAGMATDGAATSATGAAPVFSSASYNFGSGDVGAWIFIASGTNWIPGWYKISSVAANAATLNATLGQAVLYGNSTTNGLSTATGCATTASPTGATWSIDYSQQASAQFAYTDLVIQTTTTQLKSTAHPFGVQQVGNLINVTSGTNFTAGWYVIKSIASGAAVCDRSVGTAAASSGHGNMGGSWATLTNITGASPVWVAGNIAWFTTTTSILTITSTYTFEMQAGTNTRVSLRGYGTYRGDGTQAEIKTATNSVNLITLQAVNSLEFMNINMVCTAGTQGHGVFCSSNNSAQISFVDCTINGFNIGINGNFGAGFLIAGLYVIECTIENCTSHGIQNAGYTYLFGCYLYNNTGDGFQSNLSQTSQVFIYCTVASKNGAAGFHNAGASVGSTFSLVDSVAYNNTSDGYEVDSGAEQMCNIINCIFESNGGYGIDFKSPASAACVGVSNIQRNNAFYNNTSGARNTGAPAGIGDVTATGDVFVAASTGNFTLNGTAGAGAALQTAGWQSSLTN